jgi:RNA recognition motif-containing protein
MLLEITNMNLNVMEADLKRLFAAFGKVSSVYVFRDQFTHRSHGRAHVRMPAAREARNAIAALQGKVWVGNTISVVALPSHLE